MNKDISLDDIQGTILRPRPILYFGSYHVFTIDDAGHAVTLIKRLLPYITSAARWHAPPEDAWINVTFSWEGLRKLGLPKDVLGCFPREFVQGMAARKDVLGDVGANDPSLWDMPHGGSGLDIGLLIMAGSEDLRAAKAEVGRQAISGLGGVRMVYRLDVGMPPTMREHFGFVDGISRPFIEGQGGAALPGQTAVKAGEFVLGYENELGHDATLPGPRALWQNGTFVSLRKIRQDVAAFRRFLRDNADTPDGQELLAAQMMGRWRSGCPLALAPDRDDPILALDPARNNDFRYRQDDPDGHRTPTGSHIRRVNPRDALDDGVVETRLHQILRRGSAYGPVLPEGMLEDDGVDRGLVLAVINASPARQFEFVQSQWINDGDFISQGERSDPIAGRRDRSDEFSVPRPRRRYRGLSAFSTTRGGEHLFLPGLGGIRWMLETVGSN